MEMSAQVEPPLYRNASLMRRNQSPAPFRHSPAGGDPTSMCRRMTCWKIRKSLREDRQYSSRYVRCCVLQAVLHCKGGFPPRQCQGKGVTRGEAMCWPIVTPQSLQHFCVRRRSCYISLANAKLSLLHVAILVMRLALSHWHW